MARTIHRLSSSVACAFHNVYRISNWLLDKQSDKEQENEAEGFNEVDDSFIVTHRLRALPSVDDQPHLSMYS